MGKKFIDQPGLARTARAKQKEVISRRYEISWYRFHFAPIMALTMQLYRIIDTDGNKK
jgi:hypothetical protein